MASVEEQVDDRSPNINHPLYPALLLLLANRTQFPLSLAQFRDQFLPVHDTTGVASTYMQFHQWYSTFRGYFASLPDNQQARCVPPRDLKPHAAMMTDGHGQSKLNVTTVADSAGYGVGGADPLPYRTEVDCALAHYLPAGKFPNDLRTNVLNDARLTTHPDVFLPLVHHLHEQLLEPFAEFYRMATYNLTPAAKTMRLVVSVLALVIGMVVVVFCMLMKVQWWWRLIPLPWMSVAVFYLTATLYGLDPMRYWFGLTTANTLAMWINRHGKDKEKGLASVNRVAMVMDERVKDEQARRMLWVYGISIGVVVVFWVVGLVAP
jgi:hypothetical protein